MRRSRPSVVPRQRAHRRRARRPPRLLRAPLPARQSSPSQSGRALPAAALPVGPPLPAWEQEARVALRAPMPRRARRPRHRAPEQLASKRPPSNHRPLLGRQERPVLPPSLRRRPCRALLRGLSRRALLRGLSRRALPRGANRCASRWLRLPHLVPSSAHRAPLV